MDDQEKPDELKTRIPDILDLGIVAQHNQACAVFHQDGEPAVLSCNTGVFHPSWEAQRRGWHLVQAESWIQRKVLKLFFGVKK